MISICIPAYKYIDYLPEAIDSCLSQNGDFEVVVLDDFNLFKFDDYSNDDINLLRKKYRSDLRVKWYENTEVLPISENWNKAVKLSRGEYVKLMGADDRLRPDSIAQFYKMIEAYPNVEFHGHLANIIDSHGRVTNKKMKFCSNFSDPVMLSGLEAVRGKLRQSIRFREPVCNFFKRTSWEAIGGYSSKYRFCSDIYFNILVMRSSNCALWNKTLVDIRRHEASDGARLPASLAISDLKGVVSDALEMLGSSKNSDDIDAANGWVLYRLFELTAKRILKNPKDIFLVIVDNPTLIFKSPKVYMYAIKLAVTKFLNNDLQQNYDR